MSNPLDGAIKRLEWDRTTIYTDKAALESIEAALRVLRAAAAVEAYYALCAIDEPQMPEKGTESWKDWVRGQKQLRAFIEALPGEESQ